MGMLGLIFLRKGLLGRIISRKGLETLKKALISSSGDRILRPTNEKQPYGTFSFVQWHKMGLTRSKLRPFLRSLAPF